LYLQATDGPRAGNKYPLSVGDNRVGRSSGDILLDFDKQVSAEHCLITIPEQSATVTDLDSTNGTQINGERLSVNEPAKLGLGDVLTIGDGKYRFVGPSATRDFVTGTGDSLKAGAARVGVKITEGAAAAQPHVAAAADKARKQAGALADQARLATRTGIKPAFLVLFGLVLIVACMLLPPLFSWPMVLQVSGEAHMQETSDSGSDTYGDILPVIAGSDEYFHGYAGFQYVSTFIPFRLRNELGLTATLATLLAGPAIITGSPVTLAGTGYADGGVSGAASASLALADGRIWWMFAAGLVLLLIVADVLIGDQWAMQKALGALVVVWLGYAIVLGTIAAFGLRAAAVAAVPYEVSLYPTFSGLIDGPVRIAVIGGAYWGISVLLRRYLGRNRR
jgi:hypothetical protein